MKPVSNLSLSQQPLLSLSSARKRRGAGLMAGALILGLLTATPVLAEPGRKHEPQYRSQPYQSQAAPRYDTRYQAPPRAPHQAYPRADYEPRHRVERRYHFRGEDRAYLRHHYRDSLRSVRAERRPHFAAGRVIPVNYRPHIHRLPQHLGYRLPPPPRGYHVGYYEGYSVVYDPITFTILGVLDLLTR